MYHGVPLCDQYRGIFHTPDVPDDLFAYDESECHTLIPRLAGIDGLHPASRAPFAARITSWCSSPSANRCLDRSARRSPRLPGFP